MTAQQQFIEGRSLVHGYSGKRDLATGACLLQSAAARDHAEASFELACLYIHGRHYKKDMTRGVALLQKAAALGSNEATSKLGAIYAQGEFGASDFATARDWLMERAALGDQEFECNLGQLAENTGAFAEAARWYRLAITRKHDDAMWRLANLLLEGKGVLQNVAEALRLLKLASSEFDSAPAYYLLGVIYDEGKYVAQDRERAGGNFYLAAERGHVLAQMRYGESAEAGFGDPEAPNDAYVSTRLALEQLPEIEQVRAKETLARIKARMTPAQAAEAENEAREELGLPPV